ncbi:MAG: hypothetical protein R3Y12_05280 [Clostridia bacterium]
MVKIFDFGYHRGSYILHRLQNMDLTVHASPRVLKMIKNEIANGGNIDDVDIN